MILKKNKCCGGVNFRHGPLGKLRILDPVDMLIMLIIKIKTKILQSVKSPRCCVHSLLLGTCFFVVVVVVFFGGGAISSCVEGICSQTPNTVQCSMSLSSGFQLLYAVCWHIVQCMMSRSKCWAHNYSNILLRARLHGQIFKTVLAVCPKRPSGNKN